ncbi:MAG: ATP-binding protein [Anaerolineae bacterium]|nr:ATP-binding protein [Anaerolineae bacterium]MDW8098821.1 ATP-binding protein [Anaerolineae bacterium]
MRSLRLKLMGAFALVMLISVVANSLLISQAASGQFSRYVTESGRAWAQRMAPMLADHYARAGGWQGAEALLHNPWSSMMGVGMGGMMLMPHWRGGMMGWGRDQERGPGWSMSDMMNGDMWAWMGLRLLLADEQGVVVADSAASLTGTKLKPADLAAGVPIWVDGRLVGTLLAVLASTDATTLASDFLKGVRRLTWLVSLTAGMVALALGLILFRHIVAPVRAVTMAAQRIAAGHLDQRVPVTSQDEIGQLASAFNYMADALARDQELRRNMIADIAHELRTPLSVIQANLEAMLDGVLSATPQEIASLRDEVALLARLVADLRLLSLAEAGQLKLERVQTDLGVLVSRVVERMQPQAEINGIELETDVAPTLSPVYVDADRISQVVGNLVSNALRYTPVGGKITVRVGPGIAADDQTAVAVSVTDTGTGLAPEDLPHVFDRFYRADKSRSRSSGGSGIGLAIVKQLVEAHGGRVWVESPVFNGADGARYGTRFTFVLPMA